jgi:cyclophilin family peptidyl-prolyl cis-trans isomerase
MTRAAAALLLGFLAAVAAGQAQQRRVTPPAVGSGPTGIDIPRWQTILRIEDARAPTSAEVGLLLSYARRDPGRRGWSSALELHDNALRALGRLERLDLVPALKAFLADPALKPHAELALLLTLRAHASDTPDARVVEAVDDLIAMPAGPVALGNLPLNRRDQFAAVEERLHSTLDDPKAARAAAARGFEALVRRNRRIGQLTDESIDLLQKGATWSLPEMRPGTDEPIVFHAAAALLAAGKLDETAIRSVLRERNPGIRRLGALALLAAGSSVETTARTELIRGALRDRDAAVRYEALRAWARSETQEEGCGPVIAALSDTKPFIVLAAIDALGERCREDEAVTARLAGELGTPPNGDRWHREARALVAMARREPERAAAAMPAFSRHLTWQVRMYAARAAVLLKDADTLALLAHDVNDNVRHAAIPALHRLNGADSEAALIAALARDDYQLLLAVAETLKGAATGKAVLAALTAAFERATAQKKDTARDTRRALLERIVEQAGADAATLLERLATDYDPMVASDAVAALATLTGRVVKAAPQLLPRPAPPTREELEERMVARVELDNGGVFDIAFDREHATLAYVRFSRLARSGYFDGLTFHRVAPNFVIQGGSPGANEYAGDALYMRDELTGNAHSPGTVGLSTRGRDTGDAQWFVNLVENRSLELEYTVYGSIVNPRGGAELDEIMEGTRIRRVRMVPPRD